MAGTRSAPLYQWPLAGHIRVTCEFGSHDKSHHDKSHPHGHGGIDLGAIPGTQVLAARDGRVLHSGTARGYGHWARPARILRKLGSMGGELRPGR